jgi:NitT/TauT family transport system permease protein
MYARLFKLTWVLMSIVILCIIAIGLYAILDFIEKHAQKW